MEVPEIYNKLEEIWKEAKDDDKPYRKAIIQMFPIDKFKKISYEDVKEHVKNITNRADYHLQKLVKYNILERAKGRGFYYLNEIAIQPMRKFLNQPVPICLIGGLGDLNLFSSILKAFEQVSLVPKKYILFTSPEVHDNFKTFDKSKFSSIETEVCELDYKNILRENLEKVNKELDNRIKKQIYDYEIICEITGGTKPVSIGLMNLALKYGLRRCYFSGRKILWL